ncbi:hypothetical protein B0I37DRAFT_41340 [Chaetomium sp. MPI-CAGE-AT-0009]|nr:hypothetical protein B0I37DRAFT_41340 [Chaetomium sp. MPI-CAGE-AT-0009]
MSQYPNPYGYGQYHGEHPHQPYAYPNVPGYPTPMQAGPYNPSTAPIHRDASQAAFDLNATYIPGLGIGGASAHNSHHNFASSVASWTQPPGFAPFAPSGPPAQTSGPSPYNLHRSQTIATHDSKTSVPPLTQSAPTAAHPTADVEMEEGELSEGQFEDLYEPREEEPDAPVQPVSKPLPFPVGDLSQPASAADTPDGGFYGSDDDGGDKEPKGNDGRERSASYSPFLSPREIQSEIPTPQPAADKKAQPNSAQPVAGAQKPAVPGLELATQAPITSSSNGDSTQIGDPSPRLQTDPLSAFTSLQEAKKEAQKAILRLWPLGVKYQNYLDEGFDEKLIKNLFLDLRLDMPKTVTASSATQLKATQQTEGSGADSNKPSKPSGTQPQHAPIVTKDSSTISEQTRKGEERKDRIARLLAAKAAKAPAAPNPPMPAPSQPKRAESTAQHEETAPAPPASAPSASTPSASTPSASTPSASTPSASTPSASTPSASAPPKPKTWGEKERLIQQKIAALHKSREAQKSATDTASLGSTNGAPVPPTTSTGSPAPLAIPTGPRAANGSHTPASGQATPSQPRQPLPGLMLSANAPQTLSNQRKRPVASDFVEYSTGPAPAKRPFTQARKETSLIIDVTDESDDEEMEMDMDMGSPVDETLPIQSSGTLGQRGPAVRDFPPLTDSFPQRRISSPAPSVTPPGGRVNSKKRTELDLKEKAIQDMRRKIALAEAKRKVKQSSGGSVTPGQTGSESKDGETPRVLVARPAESMSSPNRSDGASPQLTPDASSTRLSQPAEMLRLDPRQRELRRGRIMSLEIPRVESSLTEKMKRMKQLQDEQARLKAEIENSVAEQRRLADELQQLEAAPPADSPRPNGLHSENGSGDSLSGAPKDGDQQDGPSSLQTGSPSIDIQTSGSSSTGSESDRGTGAASTIEGEASQERAQEGPQEGSQGGSPSSSAADLGTVESGDADSAERLSNTSAQVEPPLPNGEGMIQADGGDASALSSESQQTENTTPPANSHEQVDSFNADETTPMELDSRSPSPEAAGPTSSFEAESPAPLPDQISSAAQPRKAVQEIETDVAGEVHVVSSCITRALKLTRLQVHDRPTSQSDSRLMPYESPLRYFHAYRFHPEYKNAVAGGLRSLTYSNRIDPEKELCPFELTGEQCPANCDFQHFGSISPPDDQILLELGNSDDYSGEQKSRFIQGLRELLQKFKAQKVKDFDTIARGIIEFRSQFLGDKSKVLRLEGVAI